MYLLGYDIGSSSIKAAIIDGATGKFLASATSPSQELEIAAPKPGWAEQSPEEWWDHVKIATTMLAQQLDGSMHDVGAIGISYQMHGLVVVDKQQQVLRPSIIWCDSRAVAIGDKAFDAIGHDRCLSRLLNSPGNFTASKMRWIKENEPDIYSKIDSLMLPGDYIALRLTGAASTTETGLSEGIFWDYQEEELSNLILDHYDFDRRLIPPAYPSFAIQGELLEAVAKELDLKPRIPISYRAGDQPNNALALNVLNPGELAASAGTSGVVYGISPIPIYDPETRVNTFIHVNHTKEQQRFGVLLCVNGTGRLNSWLKQLFSEAGNAARYEDLNKVAGEVPIGSDELVILPFGNGAERTLLNRDIGASIHNLQFNTHTKGHMLRAAQEGIAFAMNYGLAVIREMGMDINVIRAANTGMFQSEIFQDVFTNITGATIELYDSDGAIGAARGAGIGCGYFSSPEDAFEGLRAIKIIDPDAALQGRYAEIYSIWVEELSRQLAAD